MDFIESNYVHKTYANIAEHFSSTRYAHWSAVKKYLESLSSIEVISDKKINFLDFGCGNGKYLSFCEKFNTFALDNCDELLHIVKNSYPTVQTIKADVADLDHHFMLNKLEQNYFDSIISVAVIHHLSTESRRIKMIENIYHLLKLNGTCLITSWATTYLKNINTKTKCIRLDFENNSQNDYLITWNNTYERYYHFFEPNEFEDLIAKANLSNSLVIKEKIFECDNWIVLMEKI